MDQLLVSSTFTAVVTGAAVAGCVILSIILVLSDDRRLKKLAVFNNGLMLYMVPLLILFAYIVIFWGARILTK